jgi:hypothetical protein
MVTEMKQASFHSMAVCESEYLLSVTTLRLGNGFCFEKSKYDHCVLLNSRHFEASRHISSQTSMRTVQITLFDNTVF